MELASNFRSEAAQSHLAVGSRENDSGPEADNEKQKKKGTTQYNN